MPRKANWSRPLPRALKIPGIMTLKTLADVRELIEKHLPPEFRERDNWHHVAKCLTAAANGGDVNEVSIALRLS
jgi:hypothetical protein